ncbi:MAG: efflux RND transporter permease subunit [Myxococcales bacterium]|nr:efflux RND transporter permease subunit [Myxococcales bacterium]
MLALRALHRAAPLALLLACTAPPERPAAPVAAPAVPAAPIVPPPPVRISVHAEYPGAAVEEVERALAEPLERALADIPGLVGSRSVSRPGRLELTLELPARADVNAARVAAYERLQAVQRELPASVSPPMLAADPHPHAALVFTLHSAELDAVAVRRLADELRDHALRTPGVADVIACGGRDAQLEIQLDPSRLGAYGVSILDIIATLRRDLAPASARLPGAVVRGAPGDVGALAELVVREGDIGVRLRDLATIAATARAPACDAVRLDGAPVVLAAVYAARGARPDEFTAAVRGALTARAAALPPGVTLEVPDPPPHRLALALDGAGDVAVTDLARRLPALAAPAVLQVGPREPGATRLLADLFVFADPAPALSLPPGVSHLASGTVADAFDDPTHHVVRVTGPDLDVDAELAARFVALARETPGVALADVRDDRAGELALTLRRDRLADRGLQPAPVRDVVAALLGELPVGGLHEAAVTTPVILRIGDGGSVPGDPAALAERARGLALPGPSGPVPLTDVVDIRSTVERAAIVHHDRRRCVEVDVRYRSADPAARKQLQDATAAALQLPPGHAIVWD